MEHKKWSYKLLSTLGVLLKLIFVDPFKDFFRWINLRPKNVRGEVIVITGSASGLGKAMAVQLARKGAKIMAIDIDMDGLNATIEEIKEAGGETVAWKGDISKELELKSIACEILNKYGQVDIVICNAAVLSFASFMQLDADRLKSAFDINVIGTTMRAFLPSMQKRRRGQVVCISSITAFAGETNGLAYCPTKAAVRSAMECLQMELKDNGYDDIKCSTIYPYFARTPLVLNAGMRPTSTWFPFMSVDSCASRMVDAILKEKVHAFIPSYITLIPMFKGLLSLHCSATLRQYLNIQYVPTCSQDSTRRDNSPSPCTSPPPSPASSHSSFSTISSAANSHFPFEMADFFRLPSAFWMTLIPVSLFICYLTSWHPSSLSGVPYLGESAMNLSKSYPQALPLFNYFLWSLHVLESVYSLWVCDKLKMSLSTTAKWFLSVLVFGYPSLSILLSHSSRTSKRKL